MSTADLILVNGKVITVDPRFTLAQAVAVKGERILAVGSDAEVRALAGRDTAVIDVGGRAVIPGLTDGHAHMDREGLKDVYPSLAGCKSVRDVLDRIAALARAAKPGEWIVTMPIGEPPYYWDTPKNLAENRWPTRQELDEAAPDNPVYIRPIWGFWRHTLPITSVASTRALELAGITRTTPPPADTVTFEKDSSGDLTGVIHENTPMPVVELGYFNIMPGFTHAHRVRGLKNAMRIYNSTGTTSVLEEHGCAPELIHAYQAVRAAGESSVRANLVFSPSWSGARDYAPTLRTWGGWLARRGLGDAWLRVGGLFTEFGLSAEALFRAKAAPYTGWSGFNYDCGVPRERMVEFMTECARADIRVCAIWTDFLPYFEEVNKVVPLKGRRWICGHINSLDDALIERAEKMGVVMTTHTNRYIFKEGHLTRQKLGKARENEIVPLKSLRSAGVHVGLATDNVPTTLWHPVWHTISRYNRYSNDAIAPDQAVSREDALRCATIEGAYLTFEENDKGSLEAGKLADFAVLSADPLTCAEDAIKDIVAETTVVGGRVVHRRDGVAA
jgi:hypothetical protein